MCQTILVENVRGWVISIGKEIKVSIGQYVQMRVTVFYLKMNSRRGLWGCLYFAGSNNQFTAG